MRRVPAHLTENARALRNGATEAERVLWRRLSSHRPRFTRQLVIDTFIVDLACRTVKLGVELDGSQHLDATAHDARRTAMLEARGWAILRFWNRDVLRNPDGIAEAILHQVAQHMRTTHPQPLPSKEGRRLPWKP